MMTSVIQNKGDGRKRLVRQIHDVYFMKNIRNTTALYLSEANLIVKALRPMNFQTDEISLSRILAREGLENTKEMREAIMQGIEDTIEEANHPDFLSETVGLVVKADISPLID